MKLPPHPYRGSGLKLPKHLSEKVRPESQMRLPEHPCESLGGHKVYKKDRRPVPLAEQMMAEDMRPKKSRKGGKPGPKTYRTRLIAEIKKECKSHTRTWDRINGWIEK